MTLTQAKRAFRLFKNGYTPKQLVRYNVVQYLKAIETLGDKWILATPIQKKGA